MKIYHRSYALFGFAKSKLICLIKVGRCVACATLCLASRGNLNSYVQSLCSSRRHTGEKYRHGHATLVVAVGVTIYLVRYISREMFRIDSYSLF
jgi:hypothetical protein